MKILYGARMARWDLLRATCVLATRITIWTLDCDKRLHKLVCYIYTTLHFRMVAWVGDDPADLRLECFADADFAGDASSMKSTSGVLLALVGPSSFVPLGAMSKKQTCVSTSTPEAEMVAANIAIRQLALPALPLWETVLGRKMKIIFREDNEATIKIIEKGYSPALRRMNRTHKVNIAWVSETMRGGHFTIVYVKSCRQAADIFTKAFLLRENWLLACRNIAILDPALWGNPPTWNLKVKASKATSAAALEDFSVLSAFQRRSNSLDRVIVEWCCSPHSRIGKATRHTKNCRVIRLTKDDDMTSNKGLQVALQAVNQPRVHLWSAMPCTGGSPWQRINALLPGGEARIRAHIDLFKALWENFVVVAARCIRKGGHVSIEWPRSCAYWREKRVQDFLARHSFESIDFDGCMVGLTDGAGTPVRKPWRVASTSGHVLDQFAGLKCRGHMTHAQCRGKVCKNSENYTERFVARVHRATSRMALDWAEADKKRR